ncbi:ABC transporter permease [Labrys miyagiensis]|uniref:ABC transporter permease n=1 Tax=Labrys miyagiensis TaxID=346912 RepID=A0ABQ6CCI1_9HYPH|nr:ABC transporter permease [Labrys miyagiensis]GLS17889.1 ABC transporter permease [Labrys miyagiensis]
MTDAPVSTGFRAAARRRRLLVLLGQLVILVGFIGTWQIASDTGVVDPLFFGSPTGVVTRLADWFVNGTAYGSFWFQIFVTLEEAAIGFVVGVASGVFMGILLGQVDYLSDVMNPYIKFLNAIPRIVLGSIFVMWLGLGLAAKAILAAVLVFFVVFFNAYQGVRSVDPNLVANIRILGGSRADVIRQVIIPSAMTWIVASLHVALGFSIIGAIVGEILGAQHGLGLVIKTAQNTFDSDGVFGCMFVIGMIVLGVEMLMARIEKRLLAWRKPTSAENIQDV